MWGGKPWTFAVSSDGGVFQTAMPSGRYLKSCVTVCVGTGRDRPHLLVGLGNTTGLFNLTNDRGVGLLLGKIKT